DVLGVPVGRFEAGDRVDIRMPFSAALMNGRYTVFAAIADRTHHPQATTFHDWINEYLSFSVVGSACQEGVVDLCGDFELDRLAASGDATRSAVAARGGTASGACGRSCGPRWRRSWRPSSPASWCARGTSSRTGCGVSRAPARRPTTP